MQQIRWASFAAVALLAFSMTSHGQQDSGDAAQPDSPPPPSGAGVPTLHAGTHLVVLDVVVTWCTN